MIVFQTQVLIVGGGDGGIAREVAKHDVVKRIVQCEIDGVRLLTRWDKQESPPVGGVATLST